jgi:putative nucleotidyltransferase with HDIG domain
MSDSMKSQILNIKNLPTLPVVAQKILHISDNSTLSIDKLKNIVEIDPAIMARILSVANSAYFSISVHTTNLHDAIMRIGLNTVKSIAIGISVLALLNDGKKTPGYTRLYNHALFVGLNARSIAKKLKMSIAEDMLIEGLLHDLGYLVLNKYFPDVYKQIAENLVNDKSILDTERDIIDHTHADIGFWLAEKWNLPDTTLDTILYHHTPSLAKRNEKHVSIVHIADYITAKYIYSPIDKESAYPFDQSSLDILSISDNDLKDIEQSLCKINTPHNEEGIALAVSNLA